MPTVAVREPIIATMAEKQHGNARPCKPQGAAGAQTLIPATRHHHELPVRCPICIFGHEESQALAQPGDAELAIAAIAPALQRAEVARKLEEINHLRGSPCPETVSSGGVAQRGGERGNALQ